MALYRCEYCDEMRDKHDCPAGEWERRLACETCFDDLSACPNCRGVGRSWDGRCWSCNGTGLRDDSTARDRRDAMREDAQ